MNLLILRQWSSRADVFRLLFSTGTTFILITFSSSSAVSRSSAGGFLWKQRTCSLVQYTLFCATGGHPSIKNVAFMLMVILFGSPTHDYIGTASFI